jgi:hypothetical protein
MARRKMPHTDELNATISEAIAKGHTVKTEAGQTIERITAQKEPADPWGFAGRSRVPVQLWTGHGPDGSTVPDLMRLDILSLRLH